MSMSMTKKVSAYHERIVQAVARLRGSELSQAQILKAYEEAFPDREDDLPWIQGTDHSSNHTNRGPCQCSKTPRAIFERLGRSRYRVLYLFHLLLSKQFTDYAKLDALHEETQRLESIYQRKLDALGELKKSLLHQAFSGAL